MAWVEKRSTAAGSARYDVRYRDSQRRSRKRTFTRKVEAERFAATVEADLIRGDWHDPRLSQIRLADWLDDWLGSVEAALKPKTANAYRSLIRSRISPVLGDIAIGRLVPTDIRGWLATLDGAISPSRARQSFRVLSQALAAAVADGRLVRNPAAAVKAPRVATADAPYLEPADVERAARAALGVDGLIIRILGQLGLRFGELAALRRRSVDLLGKRLVVSESVADGLKGGPQVGSTKTHQVRRVPLTRTMAKALEAHLSTIDSDPDAFLFASPRGGPLRYWTFRERWQRTLRRAGLPAVGLHALRHSAASALVSAGATPKMVQSVMGHSTAAFTLDRYGHLFPSDLDAIADRLDAAHGIADVLPLADARHGRAMADPRSDEK